MKSLNIINQRQQWKDKDIHIKINLCMIVAVTWNWVFLRSTPGTWNHLSPAHCVHSIAVSHYCENLPVIIQTKTTWTISTFSIKWFLEIHLLWVMNVIIHGPIYQGHIIGFQLIPRYLFSVLFNKLTESCDSERNDLEQ